MHQNPRTAWLIATAVTVLCLLGLLDNQVAAGDWPQWHYDAGGGAVSPDELPAKLHLQWTRVLPAPQPAWPASQPALRFDESYSPVVAGKQLFVPSMITDSVTAYDTETGERRWRFHAEGPVRFAPIAANGKVYFGSDDGYLYCLDAAGGSLIWKCRGGPTERRVLGNGRLISTWPVRTGPVLHDGTVYFTASIWAFMGVFVQAVDAQTGESVWANSGDGSNYMIQPHNSPAFSGFIPRGQLAATEHGLVAPGGRTPPACFDLKTGRQLHFLWAKKGSRTHHVSAAGEWLFDGITMSQVADGQVVCPMPMAIHDAQTVYYVSGGQLVAQRLQVEDKSSKSTDRKGKPVTVKRRELAPLWKVKLPDGLRRLFLKAGSRFYFGDKDTVTAVRVDSEKGRAEVVWQGSFEGEPWTMLAADEKLFLVTTDGRIRCFGAKRGMPKVHANQAAPSADLKQWQDEADSILKTTHVDEGYLLMFGLGDSRLAEALVRNSKLHLVAIDPDADKVKAFRHRMDEARLYGSRISVHVGDPATFALPPYMASLAVSADLQAAGIDRGTPFIKTMFAALRPYGGTACLRVKADRLRRLVDEARLTSARVKSAGENWSLLIRDGALTGSADWTHNYGDPANSVVSNDTLVKTPLGLLWFGGPSNDEVLPRHGHGPSPQVAGGRLVIEGRNMLRAIDIYTGRLLWQRDFPDVGKFYDHTTHEPGAGEIGSNFVTLPDCVYVVLGDTILELDAASGRDKKRFTLEASPDGQRPNWGFIAADGELLVATSTPVVVERAAGPAKSTAKAGDKHLVKPNDQWEYLLGADPADRWTDVDFNTRGWKTGVAGFGYGDGDDRTTLKMHGRFKRLYIRKNFEGKQAADAQRMALLINYDDAFIAYLNGHEVARSGVTGGRGPDASEIRGHEIGGHERFPIKEFRKLIRPGRNLLAIEGHNVSAASSDFSLDPYLVIDNGNGNGAAIAKADDKPTPSVSGELTPVRYASASRRLVVFNRHSGKKLWQREAAYGFRHNNIAIGAGKLFAIDAISAEKRKALKRRGQSLNQYSPRLMALDPRTGKELWSTGENVFGTFLNYSAEHDILLQAGSAARDRARDEVNTGMVAYRGADGKVIWKDLALSHGGPCMLHGDTIITQGPAFSLLTGNPKLRKHPLTGEPIEWRFTRNYGCNTATGAQNLLLFRSAAAGFYDLTNDGGTGNFGGFKSGCTSNLIAAGGLLNAPEYTRTCTCNYQNQTSLAMSYDPAVEVWTFNSFHWEGQPVRRVGINFGAPGDRRAAGGTLWLDWPSGGSPSPNIPVALDPTPPRPFRYHASRIEADRADGAAGTLGWVAASGLKEFSSATLTLAKDAKAARKYTVRLHFAELDQIEPGQRVFDIFIQDKKVLARFDILKQAGRTNRAVVKEFKGVKVVNQLKVALTPTNAGTAKPVLCGIEVTAEGW